MTVLEQDDPRRLAASVLDDEATRLADQAGRADALADIDATPGVVQEAMPLRTVVRRGGAATISVLFGLALVDNLDGVAFGVLAPDIQDTFNLSSGTVGIVGALAGFTLFIAAIPLGSLGDRSRRTTIAGISTLVWAGAALLAGLTHAVWQLVAVRCVSGLGKANEGPIQHSILADAYPPEGRARIFSIHRAAAPVAILVGPLIAGGVASLAGGDEGWRWAFIALTIPSIALGLVTLALPEPRRGHFEKLAILGDADNPALEAAPPRVSVSAALSRLKKVRTFYFIMASLGALGFGVTTVPIYLNLVLDEHFGLDAGGRGLVGAISAVGAVVGALLAGRGGDRLFVENPKKTMWLVGGAVAALGIGFGLQALAPNVIVFTGVGVVSQGLLFAGLVPASPVVAAVVPYQLRSMGFALVGLYLSLVGGLGGALIVGALAEAHGPRMAIAIVAPAAGLVAGGLMIYGSRFLLVDMSRAAAEVREERDEHARIAAGGELPLLQVRHVDFSYGHVQVLFDVNLDVREGEVIALLGTNGAGKSTLLRVISGLSLADRGLIRLSGRTITFADPVTRVGHGIVQVPGGRAVFPSLTVTENLLAGGYSLISDRAVLERRIDRVLDLFPVLADRVDQRAGTLSGGEQQMLGIATGLLLDPRLLLIDELSLGLAPVVVQQLLEVIDRLKGEGLTMVIVEQSVNVALNLADRGVFMEKGQIRFDGPAAELLERDDLVRAVFLGPEGG